MPFSSLVADVSARKQRLTAATFIGMSLCDSFDPAKYPARAISEVPERHKFEGRSR